MLDMDDDISELGESSEEEKTVKEVETSSPQKKGKKKTKASKKMIPTEMQEALDKCLTDMLPMITKTIKQAVTASLSERFGQLEEKLEQKLCVIDSQMSHIVEKQNMIEQEMSDVKTHLSSQAETIAEQANRLDKMEKLVKASKENVIESVEEKISIKLSDTTESSLKEIELREAKRLNVMFFNVKESSSENDEVRSKKDMELLEKIQRDIGTSVVLTNVTRIGKAEASKTRPLRATVHDTAAHRELLMSAKKLRNSTAFRNVFINRDMTPLERSQWQSLVKEKREKQERAEKNGESVKWVIYRGKVVKGKNV